VGKRKTSDNIYALQYWPTWVGLGLIRLLSVLPLPLLHQMGGLIGVLTFHLHRARRRVAYINIKLCFPKLNEKERWKLVKDNFREIGKGVMSTGVNWFASDARHERLFTVEGKEIIERLKTEKRNIILLAPHFVSLEIGGIYVSKYYPTVSMYQFAKNRCMDHAVRKGRSRHGAELVERGESLRKLVRRIREGRLFYYLPDQDPGRRGGVFVPFYGIQTATFPMLSRFARMSNAVVVPCLTTQLPRGKGWRLRFLEPIDNLPTKDEVADTAKMNQVIEQAIESMPAQYFWVHKRFKSRPTGESSFYE